MQSSVDIGNIIEEISDTLKEKLINVFNPIINEKKTVESLLLNMPSIQGIIKENEILKEKNRKLEQTLQELKNKYKQTFLETSYQKSHLVRDNTYNKNIRLEIEEINDCSINISKSNLSNNISEDNNDSLSDIVLNDILSNSEFNCQLVEPKKLIQKVEQEKEKYALKAITNYARFYKKRVEDVTLSDVMNSSAGIKTWHDSEISENKTSLDSDSDSDDDNVSYNSADSTDNNADYSDNSDGTTSNYSDSNSIVKKEELFSLSESKKINPFPPNSQAFNRFNNNEKYPSIEKAPLVWSTLNQYPSKEVKEAYPDIDWHKAEECRRKP